MDELHLVGRVAELVEEVACDAVVVEARGAAALGGAGYFNNSLGPVYRSEDLNMDGTVRYNNLNNDRHVIANTIGVSTPNNIVNQHTPN